MKASRIYKYKINKQPMLFFIVNKRVNKFPKKPKVNKYHEIIMPTRNLFWDSKEKGTYRK